ncbi:hypothetical protein [Streptomyces galilaeus]|uniref:hypothetical protein n=1 Tax=Streptomyces galilaeus TaxID=33899 RepID=UPI0038F65F41
MKRRTVTLFGKAYVWCTHEGKLTLHPDVEAYTLFPRSTMHAGLESLSRTRHLFR